MFRLSQKADYGLILLSALAHRHSVAQSRIVPGSSKAQSGIESGSGLHSGSVDSSKSYVSISSVAKKNQISPKFLSQIASDLKKAGIITSKEGITGGYTLAKKAKEIKLLDVLKILDGEIVAGRCFEDDHECVCGAGDMWGDVKKQLEETIGRKTVADLVI